MRSRSVIKPPTALRDPIEIDFLKPIVIAETSIKPVAPSSLEYRQLLSDIEAEYKEILKIRKSVRYLQTRLPVVEKEIEKVKEDAQPSLTLMRCSDLRNVDVNRCVNV